MKILSRLFKLTDVKQPHCFTDLTDVGKVIALSEHKWEFVACRKTSVTGSTLVIRVGDVVMFFNRTVVDKDLEHVNIQYASYKSLNKMIKSERYQSMNLVIDSGNERTYIALPQEDVDYLGDLAHNFRLLHISKEKAKKNAKFKDKLVTELYKNT